MLSLIEKFMKAARHNAETYVRHTHPSFCLANTIIRMAAASTPEEMLSVAKDFENMDQNESRFYAELARQSRLSLLIENGRGTREVLDKLYTLYSPEPVMESIVKLHQRKTAGRITIDIPERPTLHALCHEIAVLLMDPERIRHHITNPTYIDGESLKECFTYFDDNSLAPVVSEAVNGLARHFDEVSEIITSASDTTRTQHDLQKLHYTNLRSLERLEHQI